jgi:Ca-activated chloride channel family protein
VLTPLGELGPKRADVIERVNDLFAVGGTRLIDTVMETYEELEQEPAGERIRAIVVLSDGEDTASINSISELTSMLQADESGQSIKVFTIAYGNGGGSGDAALMETIAEASGAQTYRSNPAEIEQVYRDIATFF